MGLIQSTETITGILVNNAYARIDTVSGYKGGITISLNYYVNQQAFINGKGYVKQEFHTFVPSVEEGSPNFIKQGYEHIKGLPEFIGVDDA